MTYRCLGFEYETKKETCSCVVCMLERPVDSCVGCLSCQDCEFRWRCGVEGNGLLVAVSAATGRDFCLAVQCMCLSAVTCP